MENQKTGISEKIEYYKSDVEAVIKYLSWLEQKSGSKLAKSISPDDNKELTMHVPVYDSTLLAFIKTLDKTKFMNRNYVYTYTKYKIHTVEDELKVMDKLQIMELNVIGDILSKYVIKGKSKGYLWSEGLENGVFLAAVIKMKQLVEFWTVPM